MLWRGALRSVVFPALACSSHPVLPVLVRRTRLAFTQYRVLRYRSTVVEESDRVCDFESLSLFQLREQLLLLLQSLRFSGAQLQMASLITDSVNFNSANKLLQLLTERVSCSWTSDEIRNLAEIEFNMSLLYFQDYDILSGKSANDEEHNLFSSIIADIGFNDQNIKDFNGHKAKQVISEIRRLRAANIANKYNDVSSYQQETHKMTSLLVEAGLRNLKLSASRGYDDSKVLLGNIYLKGLYGIHENFIEARRWYLQADSNPIALFNLGQIYYEGWGVDVDKTMAYMYISKSAELGDYNGRCWMGIALHQGIGVDVDILRAVKCLEDSSTHNPMANFYLSTLFAPDSEEVTGVTLDRKRSLQYLFRGSTLGSPECHRRLGELYFSGSEHFNISAAKDLAFKHFLVAADLGDVSSMNFVGVCFYNGFGVSQCYKAAFKCYQVAANNGSIDGAVNMASCLRDGRGVVQNIDLAENIMTMIQRV